MSYKTMLRHRANILEAVETQVDGMTTNSWQIKVGGTGVYCLLDLNFIRPGKDPIWTPETGTAENRMGVLFLSPTAPAVPGNRIQMTVGPTGTYMIDSDIDEAWTPRKRHHLECHVVEINRTLS